MSREISVSNRSRESHDLPRGFLASIFGLSNKNATDYLRIKLPEYDVLRVDTWIDDLCEVMNQELTLDAADLIALLYKDFLSQVRRGAKNENLLIMLRGKYDEYFEAKRVSSELQQVSMNHWARTEIIVPEKKKYFLVEIEIARRSISRGKILLMDLQNIDPKFKMTLEHLIAILFLDFVKEIKKGNDVRLFERFLENLIN